MEVWMLLLRVMLLQLRVARRWGDRCSMLRCCLGGSRWGPKALGWRGSLEGRLASMGMGIYELGEVFRLRCQSHWCLRWCLQCGASLSMLLYASVEERGYLAHCGANVALAYCYPRLIWSAAARWLRGSRDLQREIESERCMMR